MLLRARHADPAALEKEALHVLAGRALSLHPSSLKARVHKPKMLGLITQGRVLTATGWAGSCCTCKTLRASRQKLRRTLPYARRNHPWGSPFDPPPAEDSAYLASMSCVRSVAGFLRSRANFGPFERRYVFHVSGVSSLRFFRASCSAFGNACL